MHELSLVSSLIAQAKSHSSGRMVKQIVLDVGVLTCVDAEALQFCFSACRQEAGLTNARLVINRINAQGECRQCGNCFEVNAFIQPCVCGSLDVALKGGDEIVLAELEFASELEGENRV